MGVTAITGPEIVFGQANVGSSIPTEYNEERGPSIVDLGDAIMDPRPPYNYNPGNTVGKAVLGFWALQGVVDGFPSVASTNGIAATQTATGNSALTLTATGAGITGSVSIVAPETGKTVSGLVAIDGKQVPLTFGSAGTVQMWNPTTMMARCLQINSSVNDSGGAYTIVGRDVFGFKITETIVGPNNSTVTTQKAFKYIASITSSGTINSTGVIIGQSNTFGFPLRVDYPGNVTIWQGVSSGAQLVNTSTGGNHTFASSRATQTSTTPDVRGTFVSTATFDGATVRLQIYVSPAVQNITQLTSFSLSANLAITSTNFSGLFGAAQFSSV